MQKWEYRVSYQPEISQIRNLGLQGWELCGININGNFYFKRPLVETSIAISSETLETSETVGIQH